MTLFKFSSFESDDLLAQILGEIPFLDAELGSEVHSISAAVIAELPYIGGFALSTAYVACEIPFTLARIKESAVGYIVTVIPPVTTYAYATVFVQANVVVALPFITALAQQPNYAKAMLPSIAGLATAVVEERASLVASLPYFIVTAAATEDVVGSIVTEIPYTIASLVGQFTQQSCAVVSEIPYIIAVLRSNAKGSFVYGTEEDTVLRHSYSRRHI